MGVTPSNQHAAIAATSTAMCANLEAPQAAPTARPTGRPPSETHRALVQAAQAIKRERAAAGQGATLLELVHRSQVGYKVARDVVSNLRRRGQLEIVGVQRVPYRNRPVSLYAPTADAPAQPEPGADALDRAMRFWVQRD